MRLVSDDGYMELQSGEQVLEQKCRYIKNGSSDCSWYGRDSWYGYKLRYIVNL